MRERRRRERKREKRGENGEEMEDPFFGSPYWMISGLGCLLNREGCYFVNMPLFGSRKCG